VAGSKTLYAEATGFLRARFTELAKGPPGARYRAFYPEIRITTTSFARSTAALSFGHVPNRAPMPPRSRGPTCSPIT
jgi:AMP nucleosidase